MAHTPVRTLAEHCKVAREEGLRYVYVGNVPGHPWEHTYCPECNSVAIKCYGFDITGWNLEKDNRCANCDSTTSHRWAQHSSIRRKIPASNQLTKVLRKRQQSANVV